MKAPGQAPRVLSEEDKRKLIAEAKTIDELCEAIRKIGPLSKGFLRGKTDVAEIIRSLKKAYKIKDSDLLHPDMSYYSIYANLGDKINQLIVREYERVRLDEEGRRRLEEESVRIMTEQEKTDYIQSAPNPGELYKRVRQIGNFELKMGLDDSEETIKKMKSSIKHFLNQTLNMGGVEVLKYNFAGPILDSDRSKFENARSNGFSMYFSTVTTKYGLRDKILKMTIEAINNFFVNNHPTDSNHYKVLESEKKELPHVTLDFQVNLHRVRDPFVTQFELTDPNMSDQSENHYIYFVRLNFKEVEIITVEQLHWNIPLSYIYETRYTGRPEVLPKKAIFAAKVLLQRSVLPEQQYKSTLERLWMQGEFTGVRDYDHIDSHIRFMDDKPRTELYKSLLKNLTISAPDIGLPKLFMDRYLNMLPGEASKKSEQKIEQKLSDSEKTYIVAQVVANLKLSKFGSYQDYMHAALFLINKNWPVGKSKTNDEVQEIFEMVEAEMKSATSIKQEKVILSEEKKSEIVKDIVSQIKVKYSYGEYSKKDIREYLEDVTKTLIEKLDKESVAYNGKDVVELMLKIIEEWAVSAPLVPAKDLQVSAQVEQLKQEVKKLHETVKLQQQKGTEVVNVNTTKYVLVEKFNVNFKLFGIEIDNYFDISSIVEAMCKILKETFIICRNTNVSFPLV